MRGNDSIVVPLSVAGIGIEPGTWTPKMAEKSGKMSNPDAPCMEYLPTFTPKMAQM